MSKLDEIKKALQAATPGPWKWIDPGGLEKKKLVGEWEIMNFGTGGMYDQVAGSEPDEDDAHLIANAPEWLRFLLNELELVNRERDKLIEGLRWYAETDYDHKIMTDYYEDDGELFYGTELDLDRGQRARDILKEIGVTVE